MKQTILADFYEGHRTGVIETAQDDRPSYDYINKNYIQQSLRKPIHKGHRYLFVFYYKGQQPTINADKMSYFGKYRTIPQAKYNYHEEKAIVFTLPKSLRIWITHPKGTRTAEELVEAHKSAWRVANSFSRKHGIVILKEKDAGFSEHTVEDKGLDKALRPIVQEEPQLCQERLGLSNNQTSHKDKLEWTGLTAKEKCFEIEWWIDEGRMHLKEVAKSNDMLTQEVLKMSENVRYVVEWIKRGDVR